MEKQKATARMRIRKIESGYYAGWFTGEFILSYPDRERNLVFRYRDYRKTTNPWKSLRRKNFFTLAVVNG